MARLVALIGIIGIALAAGSAEAVSTSVVVSEIYGAGGNSGAAYLNDYVELFNRGTAPVSLNGWSVQYASAAGTTWQATALPNVTLAPGQYFLVQESSGGANGSALPTPDAAGAIAMSASAAKVALVSAATALSGACPADATIVDLVGYGASASCSEASPASTPATAALSNQRAGGGCTETDDNSADFASVAAAPQNTVSQTSLCTTSAVALRAFTATRSGRSVLLRWRTATEIGALGFNVYRGSVRLNRALVAAGGGAGGRSYQVRDAHGAPRPRYRLQEVRLDGTRVWLAAASLD